MLAFLRFLVAAVAFEVERILLRRRLILRVHLVLLFHRLPAIACGAFEIGVAPQQSCALA